ncbi:protein of unknown function [Pseudodesulfovibrio profundus]|uniref:Uncharacterized protein n=1 Tax=Pseudodesulfovibrio profundus TaxID=57320 RepID=A0A2C8F3J0_9BACT|nr:hypothetical protein [Pseudodesulfovibrio profundus]SOB56962.1 protein of unknown function [Pseudodesulfovibrio profundus]
MKENKLLMAKFYVVDGVSYPAAETACGHFGKNGYASMKVCRDLGFMDDQAKGSMNLNSFLDYVRSKGHSAQESLFEVSPTHNFMQNNGYGVKFTQEEIDLSRLYLVDGISYTKAEEMLDIHNRKGFATMYAVCKVGAFKGKSERNSMSQDEFTARLAKLGVSVA